MGFDLSAMLKDVSNLDTSGNRDQIEYIDIALIDQDPNNFYQLSKVDELAANIELLGLQQPIRVRDNPDQPGRVIIVSGHRRRAALQLLVDEGKEQFREVPCIRERESGSAALQELKLIYANADTRTMTSADISKQVERVEALLYQLKEEGMEFPGRMRDHVAEACKVSQSKLARLKVIREKLAPEWKSLYEDGELNESTAYALAKIPAAHQSYVFEGVKGKNQTVGQLYQGQVENYEKKLAAVDQLICKRGARKDFPCSNLENKRRKIVAESSWYDASACSKCCDKCDQLAKCKYACPMLADKVRKLRESAKAQRQQEKLAKEERERPVIEQITQLWQRFGEARAAADLSVKAYHKAINMYHCNADDQEYPERESGKGIGLNTRLPYGYTMSIEAIQRLIGAADALGCSLDYLFGRTDDPHGRLYGPPLTQKQIDEMHFDKVWLSYGDGDPDDGEWAVVIDGWLYNIATLDGADFAETVMDEFSHIAETLDHPSGKYTVHYGPRSKLAADPKGGVD